eukprot:1158748-Pelagomonas_calceolata.AAC.27
MVLGMASCKVDPQQVRVRATRLRQALQLWTGQCSRVFSACAMCICPPDLTSAAQTSSGALNKTT